METKTTGEARERTPPTGAAVRRDSVTDALAHAFFREWSRVGYADMSLERVAQIAGAGKTSLYRRWPDKAAMAADLLPRWGLTLTPVEDRGSLEADVLGFLLGVRRVLRHPHIRRIVADIHAELERNPALGAVVRPFQNARRERAAVIIERGVTRGELMPDVDHALAADLLAAPLYWRIAVLGKRANRAYVERLARTVVSGLRSAHG